MTKAEAGVRLDRFLEGRLGELTRSQVKRWVDRGLVRIEGRAVKAGHALKSGELLEVELPEVSLAQLVPQDHPFEILHEDAALLVVAKPAGLAVHPGAGRPGGTLVNALLARKIPLSPIGAPFRPGIVHRLDLGTSGLMLVAKEAEAHRALSEALARREITRRYWALLWGRIAVAEGSISGALARSRADRRRMRVVARGGREAVTHYRVLWSADSWTAVDLRLETGRTHQIRAHWKHLGHPVFGDPDYGGRGGRVAGIRAADREQARAALELLDRQALHAGYLSFLHPRTGRRLVFTSNLPEDMHSAAAQLGVPSHAQSLGREETS
ncbi:MAG TPA: RluA family pseudouridine synthase [Candidatus Eisenbacteria bacterium]|nr:RluA family pseudouridine synthase [Candidatus Eisenbacteria bacterium]